MEISQIAARFAEGLIAVDSQTQHISANARTGEIYEPGVKTMSEPKFVEELVAWWEKTYYTDFPTSKSIVTEVPYKDIPRAKCDLVLSTVGSPIDVQVPSQQFKCDVTKLGIGLNWQGCGVLT